mmetsp:Transcript_22742/g.34711  ORF Transcript_22742/g.34711 Transcript_22742/m.34711 type:complete len:82 (+) Transcript_22742:1541-1786(+)
MMRLSRLVTIWFFTRQEPSGQKDLEASQPKRSKLDKPLYSIRHSYFLFVQYMFGLVLRWIHSADFSHPTCGATSTRAKSST